jgi:hypothetical protein
LRGGLGRIGAAAETGYRYLQSTFESRFFCESGPGLSSPLRMTAPNPTISLVFATTFLSLAACSSLSLGGGRTAPRDEQGAAASPSVPSAAGAPAVDKDAIDERVFVGLTEEDSQEAARTFKDELRRGELAELVPQDELLAAVTATCGVKIWDQCLVARRPPNKLGWAEWTFKRKNDARVYRYPDMFHDKFQVTWAAMATKYILSNDRDAGPRLVEMTEAKCGRPLDSRCRVRQRYGAGFVLTVKATGETIDVMATLEVWKRDL